MFEGIRNWLYEKYPTNVENQHWYTILNEDESYGVYGEDMLKYSMIHPILTGGMLFVCNLFAQAKFKLQYRDGRAVTSGEYMKLLPLLDNPNYYQTRIDFLEAVQWMKIARGNAVIYLKRIPGFEYPDSMYVLDPHKIEWPKDFVSPYAFDKYDRRLDNVTVVYKVDTDPKLHINIKLGDLIFLYDLPNMRDPKNMFRTYSRLDGLKQTLDNTIDSLVAKNIILRTNGKEMLSSDSDNGMPLGADDEKEAKKIFNLGYGLSASRDRAFITRANVRWQSMHIALRDLGLDESTKVDGNIVFSALHIPKDILSLEAKKTTYNNFRESMTSFIQNDMVSMINDFSLTMSSILLPPEIELIGSYDHLPVMEHLNKERAEAKGLQADALYKFLNAGVPPEVALELCGLDKTIKLTPIQNEQQGQGSSDANSESEGDKREAITRHLRKTS